jgi:hypothetical protein
MGRPRRRPCSSKATTRAAWPSWHETGHLARRGIARQPGPPTGGGSPSGNGDIYTECLLRTATTDGLIIATFTPLRGLTPFVDHYLETALLCDSTGLLINAKRGMFGSN